MIPQSPITPMKSSATMEKTPSNHLLLYTLRKTGKKRAQQPPRPRPKPMGRMAKKVQAKRQYLMTKMIWAMVNSSPRVTTRVGTTTMMTEVCSMAMSLTKKHRQRLTTTITLKHQSQSLWMKTSWATMTTITKKTSKFLSTTTLSSETFIVKEATAIRACCRTLASLTLATTSTGWVKTWSKARGLTTCCSTPTLRNRWLLNWRARRSRSSTKTQ